MSIAAEIETALKKHESRCLLTCDENCFCWDARTILMKHEQEPFAEDKESTAAEIKTRLDTLCADWAAFRRLGKAQLVAGLADEYCVIAERTREIENEFFETFDLYEAALKADLAR